MDRVPPSFASRLLITGGVRLVGSLILLGVLYLPATWFGRALLPGLLMGSIIGLAVALIGPLKLTQITAWFGASAVLHPAAAQALATIERLRSMLVMVVGTLPFVAVVLYVLAIGPQPDTIGVFATVFPLFWGGLYAYNTAVAVEYLQVGLVLRDDNPPD